MNRLLAQPASSLSVPQRRLLLLIQPDTEWNPPADIISIPRWRRSLPLRRGHSMVAVAQLVESRIVIPVVVGSNPIGHPTLLLLRGSNTPDWSREIAHINALRPSDCE